MWGNGTTAVIKLDHVVLRPLWEERVRVWNWRLEKSLTTVKQSLMSHSGGSLEDKNVEAKIDSAGPSHEVWEGIKDSKRNWARGCKCDISVGKGFPSGNVTALNGKVSWQPGAKEYHKVTKQASHTRFILGKTPPKGVAASAQARSS